MRVERQAAPESFDQIRVRRKMAPEGDEIGVTPINDLFRALALEAASNDDRSLEYAAKLMRGNRWQTGGPKFRADDARFDQMQVSKTKAVQLLCRIAE